MRLHPHSRALRNVNIEAEVSRPGPGELEVKFIVAGRISDLSLPPMVPSVRKDELWRRTCFEVFVRAPEGGDYLEFNFSPSSEWAAYRFDGYRSGMRAADVPPPRLLVERAGSTLALSALLLDLGGCVSSEGAWKLALSAVIEDTSGTMSYWALTHPAPRPDFHHPDGFVLELPPP